MANLPLARGQRGRNPSPYPRWVEPYQTSRVGSPLPPRLLQPVSKMRDKMQRQMSKVPSEGAESPVFSDISKN